MPGHVFRAPGEGSFCLPCCCVLRFASLLQHDSRRPASFGGVPRDGAPGALGTAWSSASLSHDIGSLSRVREHVRVRHGGARSAPLWWNSQRRWQGQEPAFFLVGKRVTQEDAHEAPLRTGIPGSESTRVALPCSQLSRRARAGAASAADMTSRWLTSFFASTSSFRQLANRRR
jgi:hypothetical protein